MTEARDGLPRPNNIQTDKGGEIDRRSSSNGWEIDDLGSQHRDIDKLVGERRKARMRGSRAITRSDVDESWRTRGEPGPQPSLKPWNTEIVRPDRSGNYRSVDPDLIKPKR